MLHPDWLFVSFGVLLWHAKIEACGSASLDVHLRRLVRAAPNEVLTEKKLQLQRTGFLVLHDSETKEKTGRSAGTLQQNTTLISVLLECNNTDTINELRDRYGVKVRTMLKNGKMTADVPILKLEEVSKRIDVGRVEGSRSVHKMNDLSNAFRQWRMNGRTIVSGMQNSRAYTGSGVIVGILDSGIDWTHDDFIDENGESRILYYWDHSDKDDDRPPILENDQGEKNYGHEYTKQDIDAALENYDHGWDPVSNYFEPVTYSQYPIKPSAQDKDGHGTHVAGTAAGDGSSSDQKGVAPDANLIVVKVDFEGSRGTSGYILDGVDYIFKRAEELGMPAVINLSLGGDFGPHDGTSLEEQMYDSLVGPGRIVVASAGNAGRRNWYEDLSAGFAMHGSGRFDQDHISIRIPQVPSEFSPCEQAGNYVFFEGWYSRNDRCRVQITTPGGATFPRHFRDQFEDVWLTGGEDQEFRTDEGVIYVSNWEGTDEEDNSIYIEIVGTNEETPAPGTWTIELTGVNTPDGGYYDMWYGSSESINAGWYNEPHPREPTPMFGNSESDNRMTVSTPSSADNVIAVGAYTSRMSWDYFDPYDDEVSPRPERYGEGFELGEIAYFSARGPRRDPTRKPDIVAPGVGIASTFSHFTRQSEWPNRHEEATECEISWFKGNYVLPNLEAAVSQGTSMASPNVAGAIALMLEADPGLDHIDIKRILRETAMRDSFTDEFEVYHHKHNPDMSDTDVDDDPFSRRKNLDWGLGKINIDAAMAFIEDAF